MNKFPFFKSLLVVFGFILILSCDKDYNEVGANIIGDDNFKFDKDASSTVTCYNQFDPSVQSNNLPINMLGVIDVAGFGTTTASFVTQLELASVSPDIPETAVIDQVILTVPYFSHLKENSTDTYILDSVYGNGKIKLSVYENTKYLESLDGNTLLGKNYYSNQFNDFNSNIVGSRLNNSSSVSENDGFVFSAAQQDEVTVNNDTSVETTSKTIPGMKLLLDNTHFKNKLFGSTAKPYLESNAIFKQYFRGLFFKVEQFGTEKAMAQLDFSKGKIVVYYKELATNTKRKTITINLKQNTLNLFQNNYSNPNIALPTVETPTLATTNLFLKGGAGFHTYIDILGNADGDGIVPEDSPETIALKAKKWLINEANLVFTVDNTKLINSQLGAITENPLRLYLYDAVNNTVLADYTYDFYSNASAPKYNKSTFDGIKYTESGMTKYKIRITNHVKNIINNNAKNVRLGLVITEDITTNSSLFIKNLTPDKYFNHVPTSSVINPLGTILYGSDQSVEDSKRVKLEIFYTKPN
jgi:hypothetical protein